MADSDPNAAKWNELKDQLTAATLELDNARKAIVHAMQTVQGVVDTPPGTFPVIQEGVQPGQNP